MHLNSDPFSHACQERREMEREGEGKKGGKKKKIKDAANYAVSDVVLEGKTGKDDIPKTVMTSCIGESSLLSLSAVASADWAVLCLDRLWSIISIADAVCHDCTIWYEDSVG